MKHRIILLVTVFLFTLDFFGANTVIKGYAKEFAGKEIIVSTYSDFITGTKQDIGYTNIDSKGSYKFEFDIVEIKKVFIKIEDKSTWFFVRPGKVYHLNLSFDPILNKQRIYDKELSLLFNFPAPNELNQQVKKLNIEFDKFIEENVVALKKRDGSVEPKLIAFKKQIMNDAQGMNDGFLVNYARYNLAIMQNSLDVSYSIKNAPKKSINTKANIYLEYLDKKPILYNNPDYVKFFKEFFKGELKSLSLEVKGYDISKAINDQASLVALSKALDKYPFLQDDEFKGFFMLNGLFELTKDKYFKKQNILKILSQIKTSSKYKNQQSIAANIITRINQKRFGNGSNAPVFALKDREGKEVALSKFKGKPVYINFWTNWSIPSQKEMKIMRVLHKKYGNKINFISVCADSEFEKMTKFLNQNDYKWTFLHVGKNKSILEDYNVRTFPTYILLDQNLKVHKFPAGRPGGTAERATEQNIEKDFYELTKNK